jgi:hypothetical protein
MATSQAQINVGTGLKINGEAGADYALSMEGLANNAGRVSAQIDLGASPRDALIMWHAELLMQATPTQYTGIDFYAAAAYDADASMVWGDVGVADAALGDVDQLRNLLHIGSVIIEEAGTTKMVHGGVFDWPHRYISIVGHNNATGATINATDSLFLFFIQPYNWQGQAT